MSKKTAVENSNTNLNVFVVSWIPAFQSKDSEINMKHLSQAIGVSNRKKFRLVERYSLIEWARENNMDEVKDLKDFNINEDSLCKLVAAKVNLLKQEFAAYKNSKTPIDPKKQPEKPKTLESNLSFLGTDAFKRKPKLREQLPTGFSVDRSDEPDDGPDLYVVLKGFDTITCTNQLIEKLKFKIDMIMVIRDFPSFYDENGVQRSKYDLSWGVARPHPDLESLKALKSKAEATSLWQHLSWREVSGLKAKHHLALLDLICKEIYDLLEIRKIHQKLSTVNIVNIPKLANLPVLKDYCKSEATSTAMNDIELYLSQVIEKAVSSTPNGSAKKRVPLGQTSGSKESLEEDSFKNASKRDPCKIVNASDNVGRLKMTSQLPTADYSLSNYLYSKLLKLTPEATSEKYGYSLDKLVDEFSKGFNLQTLDDYRWISGYTSSNFAHRLQETSKSFSSVQVREWDKKLLVLMSNPKTLQQRDEPQSRDVYIRTRTNFGPFHDLKLYIESQNPPNPVYKFYNQPTVGQTFVMDSDHELMQFTLQNLFLHTSDGGNVQIEKMYDIHGQLKKVNRKICFHQDALVAKVYSGGKNVLVTLDSDIVIYYKQKSQLTISFGNNKVFKVLPNKQILAKCDGDSFLISPLQGRLVAQQNGIQTVYHSSGKFTCVSSKTSHTNENGQYFESNGTALSLIDTWKSTDYTDIKQKNDRQSREDGVCFETQNSNHHIVKFSQGVEIERNSENSIKIPLVGDFKTSGNVLKASLGQGIHLIVKEDGFEVCNDLVKLEFGSSNEYVIKSQLTRAKVEYIINLENESFQVLDMDDVHTVYADGEIESTSSNAKTATSKPAEFKEFTQNTSLEKVAFNPPALFVMFADGSGIQVQNDLQIKQRLMSCSGSLESRSVYALTPEKNMHLTLLRKKESQIAEFEQVFGIRDTSKLLKEHFYTLERMENEKKYAKMALNTTFEKPIDYSNKSDESKNIFSTFTLGKYARRSNKARKATARQVASWLCVINEPIPPYFESPEGKTTFNPNDFIKPIEEPNRKKALKFKHIMSTDNEIELPKTDILDEIFLGNPKNPVRKLGLDSREIINGPVWQRKPDSHLKKSVALAISPQKVLVDSSKQCEIKVQNVSKDPVRFWFGNEQGLKTEHQSYKIYPGLTLAVKVLLNEASGLDKGLVTVYTDKEKFQIPFDQELVEQ